jgi:hypothetical protein
MNNEFDDFINERDQRAAREKRVYGEIYRNLISPDGTIEVSRGEMPYGKTFFTFQTTTQWVNDNVQLVGEMKMFNEDDSEYERVGDDFGNIEITSDNIDLIKQRPVDFSREAAIAKYLLMHPFHNLPDLVLVVSAPWVDNRNAPQWKDGVATADSCDVEVISEDIDKVLLKLGKDYTVYALDGQHRLIGIRGAIRMLQEEVLQVRKKDGKYTGKNAHHLHEWLEEVEEFGITKADILKFRQENVGIKLVPAVCKGETWDQAIQRVASIFKAFNTTSVAVPKGATAVMDHEDGYAIIARQTWKEHDFLKDLKDKNGEEVRKRRLSPLHNTISAKSTVLTTMATMKRMVEEYLASDNEYAMWKLPRERNALGQPPSDELVGMGARDFARLWDGIATLPSMRDIEPWEMLPAEIREKTKQREARNVAEVRRIPTSKTDGGAHMLFRPLGQQALAHGVGLVVHHAQNAMSLEEVFERLGRYDAKGGFRLDDRQQPWWGVLYDERQDKIVTKGWKLAGRLIAYMLTGHTNDAEELRKAFANERKSSTAGMSFDLTGKEVPTELLQLPPRLV